MFLFDFITPETWIIINRIIGLLIVIAFGIWLFRTARSSTATLREVRAAAPVLLKIATEFAPDHETTLKDTTNRLEGGLKQINLIASQQQHSINQIVNQMDRQISINNQVDATLDKVLGHLYLQQQYAVSEGESRAASILQNLINDLRRERDILHASTPTISITAMGTGASAGQVASGSGIAQTQSGIDTAQQGLDKVKEEQK